MEIVAKLACRLSPFGHGLAFPLKRGCVGVVKSKCVAFRLLNMAWLSLWEDLFQASWEDSLLLLQVKEPRSSGQEVALLANLPLEALSLAMCLQEGLSLPLS